VRGSRRGSVSSLPPGPPPPSLPRPVQGSQEPGFGRRPWTLPGAGSWRGLQGGRSPAERCGTGTGRPFPPPRPQVDDSWRPSSCLVRPPQLSPGVAGGHG